MRSPWHRREGKWIHEEPGLAYFPLCLCLPLPFLPSHYSTDTASLKLLAPRNIFDIITLHAPTTRCNDSFSFIKTAHVFVHWQQINKHTPWVSIKIYSLTRSHISSAVSFVWKCLQRNNKNANTRKALGEVNSVEASTMACLNICSSATASESRGRPLCQRPGCHACEQEARHCAVNPIRLLRHTLTPFWRPERGQGTYKNRAISPANQDWKARMSFMLKSLRVGVHTEPLWGRISTYWPIRRGKDVC